MSLDPNLFIEFSGSAWLWLQVDDKCQFFRWTDGYKKVLASMNRKGKLQIRSEATKMIGLQHR